MHIILLVCSIPFVVRLLLYIWHVFIVKKYINLRTNVKVNRKFNVLVLIPVLREQSVIRETINHFVNMQVDNINLYLVIAGTKREQKGEKETTLEVVQNWIDEYKKELPGNITVDYCEASDDGGDRATQLNYAVQYVNKEKGIDNLDFIGVYDADSLPSSETLKEVVESFVSEPDLCACQQPVHFVRAANSMARGRENPLLIANAMYQSTWTVINELPMWIKYYKKDTNKISKRHLYLIGHGEFISNDIYENFHFPEYEVTDGIQLGYRLGMSNKKVKPLREFCNDDVPHSVKTLVKQHKRWFGGCMNLSSSYRWSRETFNTNAIIQVIDGLWSQARWAWTSIAYIILLICSFFVDIKIFSFLIALGLIYCYVIPIVSHKVLNAGIKVRIIDWICLPLAIFIKSIGPNMYIISKLVGAKIKYEKVER